VRRRSQQETSTDTQPAGHRLRTLGERQRIEPRTDLAGLRAALAIRGRNFGFGLRVVREPLSTRLPGSRSPPTPDFSNRPNCLRCQTGFNPCDYPCRLRRWLLPRRWHGYAWDVAGGACIVCHRCVRPAATPAPASSLSLAPQAAAAARSICISGPLGDGPLVDSAPVDLDPLVRLPVAHVELVGDDTRAHVQVLQQFRVQP
jgi:hypothetical protein